MAPGDGPDASTTRPGDAAANRAVMDRIAVPFDATRREPWEAVEIFLKGLGAGDRILDLAGGNGRHSIVAARLGLHPVLADVSGALARIARRRAQEAGVRLPTFEAEAGRLPFRTGSFDHAMFVAGVHSIRGRQARVRALREMHRVVRPDGLALITVWAAEQERFRDIIKGQRRAEATDALTADIDVGDVMVPWSKDVDEPVDRFFHVYSADELRRELEDAGLKVTRIEQVTITQGSLPDNLFAFVRCP